MKKNIIALLLSAVVLANISVYADEYWTGANDNIQTGIGNDSSTETIKYPSSIDDYTGEGWSSEFAEMKDISQYISPYEDEIELVVKLGIMTEDENGFRPQDKLTYYEYAYAMKNLIKYSVNIDSLSNIQNIVLCKTVIEDLVDITGYSVIYPDKEAEIIAEQCGILEDIVLKSSEVITREQLAKVIANTLTVDMVEFSYGVNLSYEIPEGNTLLARMKVTQIRGWVNANEMTNMYSLNRAGKDTVLIDNLSYNIGTSNAEDFVGRYVTAYVQEIDDESTIIKIDLHNRDNFISVNDADIEEITASGIVYYPLDEEGNQSNSSQKEIFDRNANVIYNGRYAGTVVSFAENMLLPVTGRVAFSDTDFDGDYDVIFVWNYEVYIAEQVAETRVLLKNNKGILDLSDIEDLIITLDGTPIKVSELGKGNVLSVAKSSDGSMYTVVASSATVQGVCRSMGNGKIILEDKTEYTLDESFSDQVELGKEYTYYLTFYGEVAGAEKYTGKSTSTGTGRNYGYLIKSAYDDFTEESLFRLYRFSDNSWVSLQGAEKISFYKGNVESESSDKDKVSKEYITVAEAVGRLAEPQLIVFDTNVYGELSSVTVAADVSATGNFDDDMFTLSDTSYNDEAASARLYYGGYFDGTYQKGSLIVLRVPSDRSQEKYYGTETLTSDGTLTGPFEIYDVDENRTLNGVILKYVETGAKAVESAGDARITIAEIEEAVFDDSCVLKITGLNGQVYYVDDVTEEKGQDSVITVDGSPICSVLYGSDLKRGDMLCATVDSLGYIMSFRVDVRLSEIDDKTALFSKAVGTTPPSVSYDYGVVKKNLATATHLVINTTTDTSDNSTDKPVIAQNLLYAYNRKTGKFEKLSGKGDILPGDKVVCRARYYYTGPEVIVIK